MKNFSTKIVFWAIFFNRRWIIAIYLKLLLSYLEMVRTGWGKVRGGKKKTTGQGACCIWLHSLLQNNSFIVHLAKLNNAKRLVSVFWERIGFNIPKNFGLFQETENWHFVLFLLFLFLVILRFRFFSSGGIWLINQKRKKKFKIFKWWKILLFSSTILSSFCQ